MIDDKVILQTMIFVSGLLIAYFLGYKKGKLDSKRSREMSLRK